MVEGKPRDGAAQHPLPKGWKRVRLEEACAPHRESVKGGSSEAKRLTYISLAHIEPQTGRMLREEGESKAGEGKSNCFKFTPSDVLYGKLRPYLNKVALPNFYGRCATTVVPLRPKKGMSREFLAYTLRQDWFIREAVRKSTGGVMPSTDVDHLLKLEVALPPPSEQKRIVAWLEDNLLIAEGVKEEVEALLAQTKPLAMALRASLIRRALSGDTS